MVGILLAPTSQDPSSTYSKAASAGMGCAIQSSTGPSDSKTAQGQTEEEMTAEGSWTLRDHGPFSCAVVSSSGVPAYARHSMYLQAGQKCIDLRRSCGSVTVRELLSKI